MSVRHNKRVDSKNQKSLPVTSKCLAIVLVAEENDQGKQKVAKADVSGKDILEDFKLRNKTCYWNPALVDSIGNLQYIGFVEPSTILVGAADIHLENLRTAWGRRVLNDPANLKIQKIGDVNGIEMQVIPQTQFIPLPEILCLIILELNNKQIIATLDVIHERLAQCFQNMQRPSSQFLYDTLGNLIRERKVFHTGSGYFVVTPDTYRLPTDQPQLSFPISWMHYNQMYIPVLNQQRTHVRDISCQVSLVSQPQHPKPPQHQQISNPMSKYSQDEEEPIYKGIDTEMEQQPVAANERTRISRSSSVRRCKEKSSKDETDTKGFHRSSSVRCRGSKGASSSPVCRDVNLAKSNINKVKDKGEKKSLLSKIFGRSKKKKQQEKSQEKSVSPPCTDANDVEYVTFSAQFPPPEWQWYQEQIEKQQRLNDWISQQKSGEILPQQNQVCHPGEKYPICPLPQGRHLCHKPPVSSAQSEESHYCQIDSKLELSMRNLKAATMPGTYIQAVPQQFEESARGQIISHENKAATLPPQAVLENHHIHRRHSESHRRRRDVGDRPRIRRHSGDRKPVEPTVPTLHEDVVYQNTSPALPYHVQNSKYSHMTEPMYSSTPRIACPQEYELIETIHNNTIDEMHNADKHGVPQNDRPTVQRRSDHGHKKSRNRHYRHSYVGHPGNDISYEYHGKLPQKSLQRAFSRDSGVNCIGLESNNNRDLGVELAPKKKSNRKSSKLKESRKERQNNMCRDVNDVVMKDKDVILDNRKNEVICIAEINNCVPEDTGEATGVVLNFNMEMVDKESISNDNNGDSVIEESEQSYDTVIDSRSCKKISNINEKIKRLNLGDSGFSSPRISDSVEKQNENLNEIESRDNIRSPDEKCDNCSHHSSSGSDKSRVYIPQQDHTNLLVLNNMKDVQNNHTVFSHHINVMQTDLNCPPLPHEVDAKVNTVQQIPFHLKGDYQVVGVV